MLAGLGVLHGAHRNRAVGGVLAGGDDLGVLALALDELEGELAGLEVAPGQGLGRGDLVGDAELVRIRLVAVVELRLVGALQDMLRLERAVAVVGDGRLDGVARLIVRDPIAQPRLVGELLTQRVGVIARLIVSDFVHDDLAVSRIGASGDDLAVFDELEGELALSHIAAGQGLGRLDLVGDAGALGGHVVGVLELGNLDVLQNMRGTECAVALVGDGGLDGVLSIAVGDTASFALDLAQRIGVLAGSGVLDGAHHDLAVGIVGAGGDHAIALGELKAELAGLEDAPGQDLGRGDLVGDAGLVRRGIVLVLKACRVVTLERMGHLKRAVAVVDDTRLDGVARLIVRDPIAQPRLVGELLTQRVGVDTGLIVSDFVHGDRAVSRIGAGGDDIVTLDKLKLELTGLKVASGQTLGCGDLVGDAGIVLAHAIGIGERKCHIAAWLAGYAQFTLAVISHSEGNLARQVGIVGHAVDPAGLGHGVGKGVLALLGLLAQGLVKVVERKGNLAKVDLALGIIGHARVRRHGRAIFAGHGKSELAGDVSRAQAIRNLQILLAHERCLDGRGSVSVLELVAGVAVDSRRRQGTIAVIDDGHIRVNCRRGSAHARGQLAGLLGSDVMNGPCRLVRVGVKRCLVLLDQLGKRLGRVRQRTKLNLATLVGCI